MLTHQSNPAQPKSMPRVGSGCGDGQNAWGCAIEVSGAPANSRAPCRSCRKLGDPATDAERHRRISPLFHTENIVKPTLVIQGANDPRVLQVESDELVAGIRASGVPVEYIVFPDEGHGFRKKVNQIAASNAYVKFLDTYLKDEASQ